MGKKKYKKFKKEIDDIYKIFYDSVQVTDSKIDALEKKIKHVDERTMALDNVKVQKTLDKTKELDSKIKILMDRTSIHYDTYSDTDTGITFENCYQIYRCMADRGATQEEVDNIKNYFNKYIFRCRMFKFYKIDPNGFDDEFPISLSKVSPPSKEIINGKKENNND